LLFRAQGRSLAHTDCLSTVMLAELSPLLDGAVDGIVLPGLADGYAPGSDAQRVAGILLGPLPSAGRLVVPVSGPMATVSISVVDTDRLIGERLETWSTRQQSGTSRSPPRTAPWRPNWSRWPTRRCASRSNTSAFASNSVLPSAHSSHLDTCWPMHRRPWKAPAHC
jgi:hypothetical protein